MEFHAVLGACVSLTHRKKHYDNGSRAGCGDFYDLATQCGGRGFITAVKLWIGTRS
jgi:hypothetical protein